MTRVTGPAVALALTSVLLGSAACGGERQTYGPTVAGPTQTSSPSRDDPPTPALAVPRASQRRDVAVCELFTNAEISTWLGLEVGRGVPSRAGGLRRCSWRAVDAPEVPPWRTGDPVLEFDDGTVSITRGRAEDYLALARRLTAEAQQKTADGVQELSGVGSGAFAVGASVSGVPIWSAVAMDGEVAVAVELSGAGSRSSVARVRRFLARSLSRS